MHVRVLQSLCFKETDAACEDYVRLLKELFFVFDQAHRRVEEGAQLIHTVVDDGDGLDDRGDVDRHGGVEPGDDIFKEEELDEFYEEGALAFLEVDTPGEVGPEHPEIGSFFDDLKMGAKLAIC